ncbi:MAG: hypothetical protein GC189_06325 [Alphaproteobacteria bacterium]|nr:hypothetical protein [Alphaproteobacteria bacterium]
MQAKLLIGAGALALTTLIMAGPPTMTAEERALRAIVLNEETCDPIARAMYGAPTPAWLAGAMAYAQSAAAAAAPPLMQGLGDAHMPISTQNAEAQAYFDQGLKMMHGFNHAEAARAFRAAQARDPACAMCYWGEAFVLGPNINASMDEANNARAYETARLALEKSGGVTPVELALIEAMQVRYTRQWPQNRAPLDGAFAEAMSLAADAHSDSDLVQILAAEAVMDAQPWDYWKTGGREAKGRAAEAVRRIETVLARSPANAGAVHLYIHLVEASEDPWRAERAAERLAAVAPNAGHLVHMPAHIYYRVGRFRESIQSNIEAARVDERYIAAADPSPIYRFGYYPHNVHFVMASAQMGGDQRNALTYADRLDAIIPMDMAVAVPLAQPVKAAPWFARAQFMQPQQLLAMSAPEGDVAYIQAAWRYARGVALARLGRAEDARAEAAALEAIKANGDFSILTNGGVPGPDLVEIMRLQVLARADMAAGDYGNAIAHLEAAVAMQDAVPYTEPPYVHYPIRRTLAAAYLMAGEPAVAEQHFLQTLIESPNDAYAYWGLAQARQARGDRRGAQAARQMFNAAFLGNPRGIRTTDL